MFKLDAIMTTELITVPLAATLATARTPVSYTHLTLPTNREV